MTPEKISTGMGMISGFVAKFVTGELASAVLVAFLTGAAAYAGQIAVKSLHKKLTSKNTETKDEN